MSLLSRRAALALGLGALPLTTLPARSAAPRVVAIDWGLAETLLALGVTPVGLPETDGYREWVSEPPLPETVAEIGLRTTPNLEHLAALRPDLILITPQFNAIEAVLGRVAPVKKYEIYSTALTPYGNAVAVTRDLGRLLGRESEAQALIDATQARIARLGALPEPRPVLIITFSDERHLTVFCGGSIYHDVMTRAGLANAWQTGGSFWGFVPLSPEHLAGLGDVAALIVEPLPAAIRAKLSDPPSTGIIGQVELLRSGRYRVVPPVWAFGCLPSAARFADTLLANADFIAGHDG